MRGCFRQLWVNLWVPILGQDREGMMLGSWGHVPPGPTTLGLSLPSVQLWGEPLSMLHRMVFKNIEVSHF